MKTLAIVMVMAALLLMPVTTFVVFRPAARQTSIVYVMPQSSTQACDVRLWQI
jgi:predicted LPLAT superfamily acyltransferase